MRGVYPEYNSLRWLRDTPDGTVVVMDECGCCPLRLTKREFVAWQWWHNYDGWFAHFWDAATPWCAPHNSWLPF